MIDNFDLIREQLKFPNEFSFYFIQILKRKKDNPDLKTYSRPIESFYVRSIEQFDRFIPHIIEKCQQNNARAYIKMNPLDIRKVGARMAIIINQCFLRNDGWWNIVSALNSACGQGGMAEKEETAAEHGKGDVHIEGCLKLWLLDIDNISDKPEENEAFREEVKEYINSLQPIGNKVVMEIPTKNGYHLLCTTFNIKEFRKRYRTKDGKDESLKIVDMHKEGNTILYIP